MYVEVIVLSTARARFYRDRAAEARRQGDEAHARELEGWARRAPTDVLMSFRNHGRSGREEGWQLYELRGRNNVPANFWVVIDMPGRYNVSSFGGGREAGLDFWEEGSGRLNVDIFIAGVTSGSYPIHPYRMGSTRPPNNTRIRGELYRPASVSGP